MKTSTVTSKGQIVIPAPMRKKLGLQAGSRVLITETEHGLHIRPVDSTVFQEYAGVLPGRGRATRALLQERREEARREDHRS
jgi:AbrB family looped-hinge helix DNA binding protein